MSRSTAGFDLNKIISQRRGGAAGKNECRSLSTMAHGHELLKQAHGISFSAPRRCAAARGIFCRGRVSEGRMHLGSYTLRSLWLHHLITYINPTGIVPIGPDVDFGGW